MNASNSRAVDAIWCVDEAQAENIFSRFETAYSSQGDCDLFSGNCNRLHYLCSFLISNVPYTRSMEAGTKRVACRRVDSVVSNLSQPLLWSQIRLQELKYIMVNDRENHPVAIFPSVV